ncbi:MAG: Uxx-star family glutaredoxin-like (seleno)protein [Candidatus Omnitrophica bacterium]|nr:Uxx-star family glutaredoxin-like (seleno)protein [Candidatus Omnitrophota bacterium]MDD5430064.1 Uxx-star family glutaredoxin-like (seleno)protein [Candidatus Omnitrophota bacterium]
MVVQVYSTAACPYCHMAKEYLTSKGVAYQNIDVSVDQEASKKMVEISGQMGVPVIVVDGKPIVGFDKMAIDAALGA